MPFSKHPRHPRPPRKLWLTLQVSRRSSNKARPTDPLDSDTRAPTTCISAGKRSSWGLRAATGPGHPSREGKARPHPEKLWWGRGTRFPKQDLARPLWLQLGSRRGRQGSRREERRGGESRVLGKLTSPIRLLGRGRAQDPAAWEHPRLGVAHAAASRLPWARRSGVGARRWGQRAGPLPAYL